MEDADTNDTPDFEPPQACIQRVIKSVLPDNAQVMKESKQAFSKAAGIFIIYVTSWCARLASVRARLLVPTRHPSPFYARPAAPRRTRFRAR